MEPNTENNNKNEGGNKNATIVSKVNPEAKVDMEEEDELIRKNVTLACLGNVDSGKSTLIGVLTSQQLDDGRGSARSRIFVHHHELENGRTSCLAHHIMGFDKSRAPVVCPVASGSSATAKNKAWRQILEKSETTVTFIDLAGHEKYLKTTIAGLTGVYPDYALLCIGANRGVCKMSKEHLGVALALEIPSIVVITHIDICPEDVLKNTLKQLFRILKSPAAGKIPVIVRNEGDLRTCSEGIASNRVCPIFLVSSVSGIGLKFLNAFLGNLGPRMHKWSYGKSTDKAEFDIDETYNVSGVGVIISGTVKSGVVHVNQHMLLGPFADTGFKNVLVRSIHTKRVAVEHAAIGEACTMGIRGIKRKDQITRSDVHRGMVLLDASVDPVASYTFEAEVLVLHHATSIKQNYQPVIHCGNIRQTARIDLMGKELLRTGDKSLVRFTFIQRPEFIHAGESFIFRDGRTKGVGKVVRVVKGDGEAVEQVADLSVRGAEEKDREEKAAAGGSQRGMREKEREKKDSAVKQQRVASDMVPETNAESTAADGTVVEEEEKTAAVVPSAPASAASNPPSRAHSPRSRGHSPRKKQGQGGGGGEDRK